MKRPITGIILAAGKSERFGDAKQLVSLNGMPLLMNALNAALSSSLDRVVLVLGYHADEIQKAICSHITDHRLEMIINKDYREGMSRSLGAGVNYVRSKTSSIMVLLGDQPLIDNSLIELLIHRYLESCKDICVPEYRGRKGHPVIFSKRFHDDLMSIKGDIGARNILAMNPDCILSVDVPSSKYFFDVDTLEDLRHAKHLIHRFSHRTLHAPLSASTEP